MSIKRSVHTLWRRCVSSSIVVGAVCAVNTHAQVGQLLWEEQFNDLDPEIWNVIEGDGCPNLCGWGNQELEWYAANNVSIEPVPGEAGNSALVLEARREASNGRGFTSGKIDSENGLSIHYGMIETRIRVPDLDLGLWPAFWMLGTSTATWPAKGEIDIMEMGHRRDAIDAFHPGTDINSHTGANLLFYADAACNEGNPTCAANVAYQNDNAYVSSTPMNDRFIIYRLYWTDTSIRFTAVDNGVEHAMFSAPFTISDESDEFRAPFYLLMNLAVGGNFTDAANDGQVTAPLPAKMYVDYIRVYEYDGQGSVAFGTPGQTESGTFGVFTDQATTNALEAGTSSDIYVWNTDSVVGGNEPPFEGDNVIAWDYVSPNSWFGGGIQSRQPRDMSQFDQGHLEFNIKVPADVAFSVGVTDTYGNQNAIVFPANQDQYGLVRNGDWGRVSIPVSELRGTLIALQSMSYLFTIASVDGAIPSAPFSMAIDNVVWTGGGDASPDTDGDGVPDASDACPGTAAGTTVDASGCPLVNLLDLRVEAEDYSGYADSDAGNNGGAYRNDDVDVEVSGDEDGGYNVGWTNTGEWLEYPVQLNAGTYALSARVASLGGGGAFTVLVDGMPLANASVDATGGWQTWQTLDLGEVTLDAGSATLRVDIDAAGFNLNWLRLQQTSATPVDSDGDGVSDAQDQCPNTPAGRSVDAQGCEYTQSLTGSETVAADSVQFYVNTTGWADIHFIVNGGAQQNVRMTQVDGRNVYTVSGLQSGDVVEYWFTYLADGGGAVDSPRETLQFGQVSADSDGDGVPDAQDFCPNTPAGAVVDSQGCEVIPLQSVRVEAEDYSNAFDASAGNTGGAYRDDDVDIEVAADVDGEFNVGWIDGGEWLEYPITLGEGSYEISARVASAPGGGEFALSLDGLALGDTTIASTGGWQNWETQVLGTVNVNAGSYTLRVDMLAAGFNLNWLRFDPAQDSDGDGVVDGRDACPGTPAGAMVDEQGCEAASDVDEVSQDLAAQRLVGGSGSAQPGFTLYVFDNDQGSGGSTCYDACAIDWPPLLVEDGTASGVGQLGTLTRNDGTVQATYQGRPLYFYLGDNNPGDAFGQGLGGVWWQVDLNSGVVPLFTSATPQEPAITFDRGDALVTRFSDRARDRHAKENHFQAYDHFLTFYWEDRTASVEIIDYVAKGGSSIRMEVRTLNKLDDLQAENRWWYIGTNTLAEYCGNGVMDNPSGDFRNYVKESSFNCREGRPIQVGDRLEFEISQFLDEATLPRGRSNYYGTTYLYIVGEGLVPWDVTDKVVFTPGNTYQRDSIPVPESARMGGDTTLHVQMTAEPDGHFQQMATNLGYDNGQPWVLGRRVHHSSAVDGMHDENAENGVFPPLAGDAGPYYINERCSDCHERNGRAPVAADGEPLDRWVFKIGDAQGQPDPQRGRVLQPLNNGSGANEGQVSIAFWSELANGLRAPNYQFESGQPATFSGRIAPNLNGLGLLEAIPEADILALEDPNDADGDGISGRANRVPDPVTGEQRLGRFGYKAATASVKHQVSVAFNTDMGVMTAMAPTPDCGSEQSGCGSATVEIAEEHVDHLVKYVSLLGVRPQRDYNDPQVLQGEQLFAQVGCVDCHTPTHTTSEFAPLAELRNQTIRPYTDMLLHDMGPGLADSLGEGQASGAEWRTAPLWGVSLSKCVTGGVTGPRGWDAFGLDGYETCSPSENYLHDGRARTLDEAIRWHGGEGQASNDAYQALSTGQRDALLRFVESL